MQEILKEESSLARLKTRFIPIGLSEGFACISPFANEHFGCFLKDDSKGLALSTSREILGRERSRRPMRSRKAHVQRKEVDQALDFSELVDGDYLVHHQHGICRFCQMGKIEDADSAEEAITLEFDDGIILHLPLQESHLLSRYVGLKKAKPKLAKLGGKAWAKTKSEAERAALDLAADLLRLQATRQANNGFAYSPDDQWQKEFEDAFPFTETVDQQKAIDQVKRDMEAEEPMDRLVCGDVGFGKTEVALRAAFKAVMDGKQVAILCPTTILCQQHLNSFRERMIDFPITVDMLSRFRTGRQQSKILEALRMGSLDLVIGTHRLLSKDVSFKDLGLLVIDEEQRFGVQDKEAIKKLKASVDVLTLSATPIPRTLYFAMVGARSLSAIETAPVNRLPIRTEVLHKSDDVLLKAINAEIRRNGQIFYLHNRVKTIRSVARKLETLFPKLRIAVGHGQMSEDELEKVMTDFVAGEFDILVCTTIIESGLDIPNCNTIVIEGADKFGLSQLYQLRGRVGRFTRQAYAYLLLNRHLTVSDQAKKRLSAIRQVNQFGAGFRIALRDLELRGAGNLLGSEQSGHIAGVGFELYCRLLKESVSRLKGDEISLRPSAVIRLDFLSPLGDIKAKDSMKALEACIPESYAAEPRLRIEIYRKLAQFQSTDEVKEYGEELEDRFGTPPDEVRALLMETEIRCLCEEANFDKLEVKQGEIFLRLVRKAGDKNLKFLRLAGKIPRLSSKTPLLKLKELIAFLKIRIH
ncbi:MAG: transcription-repair coupling factor, partial [Verrucomicrobiota bacterium]|nr:transcription-repair coupling factor [Verrucomicrobiota bacterium]